MMVEEQEQTQEEQEILTMLSDAICRNNVEKVLNILDYHKVDPNSIIPPYGWSPLHLAARDGRIAIIKLLISRGAQVNNKDVTGQTPLHRAAHWGHLDVVDFLVKSGADIFAVDSLNQIPEEVAFYMEESDIFCYLLKYRIEETKMRGRANSEEVSFMKKHAKKMHKMQTDLVKKEREVTKKNQALKQKKEELVKKIKQINDYCLEADFNYKKLEKLQKQLAIVEEEIKNNQKKLDAEKFNCFDEYSVEERGQAWLDYINGKFF